MKLNVDGVMKAVRTLATDARKDVLDTASNRCLNKLHDASGIVDD
jgi:hypothetical protein